MSLFSMWHFSTDIIHILLFSMENYVGEHSHCSQKKLFKNTLKASLKDFSIQTESWEQIEQDEAVVRPHKKGFWWIWSKLSQHSWAKIAKRKYAEAPPKELSSSNLSRTSLVLSATGSLELRLVSSATLERTNNNTTHFIKIGHCQ